MGGLKKGTKEEKEQYFKEGRIPEYKECSKCDTLVHYSKFYIRRDNNKIALYSSCDDCEHVSRKLRKESMSSEEKSQKQEEARARHKEWRKENPNKVLENRLRLKYSLSLEEFNNLLINQDFKCAICKIHCSDLKELISVDHCHSTSQVRGLLCPQCNTGLGQFKDNVEVLKEAINYLNKYKQ